MYIYLYIELVKAELINHKRRLNCARKIMKVGIMKRLNTNALKREIQRCYSQNGPLGLIPIL